MREGVLLRIFGKGRAGTRTRIVHYRCFLPDLAEFAKNPSQAPTIKATTILRSSCR